MSSVQIIQIKPADLHRHWLFIERGLNDIRHKLVDLCDWLPPDVYGAIRVEAAFCIIVGRNDRELGFIIYHRQERPWSHKFDLFLWCWWMIPLRERLPADLINEGFDEGVQYLRNVQRSIGAERLIGTSSFRRGSTLVRRYGFKPLSITYEI